jgi:uncharacterized protein
MTAAAGLAARLASPGPKRLLALDGGGIRGIISLGYLEAIERLLRERSGRPDYRLADYFDLIGGTSTGSLIATLLSLGWSVAAVKAAYLELAADVFQPNHYWGLGPIGRALSNRFESAPLEAILGRILGERTLDSADLRTGLMVVTKRVDTASVWPVVNIPGSTYFDDRQRPDGSRAPANRHFKLRELLRASTAAPTFFRAERVGDGGVLEPAVFVDGAVSTHNNPALLLLMVASLDGFGLNWPLGADNLLLCSIGTGSYNATASVKAVPNFNNLDWARLLVPQLIGDSMELVETVLQWMSASATRRTIDRTLGAVSPTLGGPAGLLTFLRYNVALNAEALGAIGVDLSAREILRMQDMSDVNETPNLLKVCAKVGAAVAAGHFPPSFDRVTA